jgi:glycerol-3-phosphate acyltransferase PlsX
LRIGIDLMGSDRSPIVLFEAVLQAAELLDASSSLVVLATREVVDEISRHHPSFAGSPSKGKILFHVVPDFIAMNDEPLFAIRHKKNSSLIVGIRLLKKRHIEAFVTAGNTGALIASATLSLPMLPGIKRPALLAVLPTQSGSVAVIDVGGNVSCKAHHLVQFAHMGAAYQRCNLGLEAPKVGLLNIGVESKKGTSEVRQAYQILQSQSQELVAQGLLPRMHFFGNVEGREVFQGKVDVLVTDGFSGNVLLKTTEGLSLFIFDSLLENYSGSTEAFKQSLNEMRQYFNYAEYPGAILCGVDGIIVKCHGNSSAKAMFNSLKGAIQLIHKQLLAKIKEQLA